MFSIVRQVVNRIDPSVPLYRVKILEKQLDNSLVTERLLAGLSSAFGLLATLLASARSDVLWLVMKDALLLIVLGIGVALPLAIALTRLVKAQLYGITPNDPLSLISATVVIFSVALIAGYVPARRATTIDPMRALRWD
jgi:hypothetical protein